MVKHRFFGNGVTNLHISNAKDTCGHLKTGLIMIFDPQNMGLETILFQLSVNNGGDMVNNSFPIMAG